MKSSTIWAVIILAAIVVSFVVSDRESARRDAAQRTQLIDSCVRNGVQKALNAASWIRAADARRADGNYAAADDYEATADGIAGTIPAAPPFVGDRALIAVVKRRVDGKQRFVLTPEAAKLQREGCIRAFGAQ